MAERGPAQLLQISPFLARGVAIGLSLYLDLLLDRGPQLVHEACYEWGMELKGLALRVFTNHWYCRAKSEKDI
jgi:hypothetical protein